MPFIGSIIWVSPLPQSALPLLVHKSTSACNSAVVGFGFFGAHLRRRARDPAGLRRPEGNPKAQRIATPLLDCARGAITGRNLSAFCRPRHDLDERPATGDTRKARLLAWREHARRE